MKEQFITKFKEQFGQHLSTLYIPGIPQHKMFNLIIYNLMNVSAELRHTIHYLDIKEVADDEYLIKVNRGIEIEYIINQEVGNE